MALRAIVGVAGNIASGLFGMKRDQGQAVMKALEGIKDISDGDKATLAASAAAIAAVYEHGGWLERSIRPLFFASCIIQIWCLLLGMPFDHITPEQQQWIFDMTYVCLIGYMPLRSLDKWMKGFQIGGILKTFIEKKVL
jgi:hypothetical protein